MTLHSLFLCVTVYRLLCYDLFASYFSLSFSQVKSTSSLSTLQLHSMLPDEDVFGESSAMGRYRTILYSEMRCNDDSHVQCNVLYYL